MMKLLVPLLIASSTAFAPTYKPLVSRKSVSLFEQDEFTATSSPVNSGSKSSSFDVQELLSSIQDFDASKITESFDAVTKNAMEGNFGERGEAYFAAQAAVVLCILAGGVPIIGDAAMLLGGPVLLTVGLAVMAVSLFDLGDSLSPWPKPTSAGLKTDGLYSKVRHPMYAGLLAACAGLSIVTGSANRLLLTAVLLYVLDVKSNYEEAELLGEYPEYARYKAQVPGKFFPQELLDALPWVNK